MSDDDAELATLSTSLDELLDRVTTMADRYTGSPREDIAADLYEVERSLRHAVRRLHRVRRGLA